MVTSDTSRKIIGKPAGKRLRNYFRQHKSTPQDVGLSRSISEGTHADYFIRRALDSEFGDIHSLMPEMTAAGLSPDITLVACSTGAPVILGAAVSSTIPNDTQLGVRGNIFVRPSQRRQGIGTALLKALANEWARLGILYFHSWQAYASGIETLFLGKNGFHPLRCIRHFQADIALIDTECSAKLAYLTRSGHIPENIELPAFRDSSFNEAIELYAYRTGVSLEHASIVLDHSLSGAARNLSFELRHDGKLLGFILCKTNDKEPTEIDQWITASGFNAEWPAMKLLQKSARCHADHGFTKIQFHCDEKTKVSLHIARIIHARLLSEKWIYALDITN